MKTLNPKTFPMGTSPQISKEPGRIQSVDLLRGAVMIIMAIDHVRAYAGIPADSLDPAIFFGRWITHYCAPTFAFLAGTSAFLYFQKTEDKNEVARFLITRGLLLVLLEMTVIRFFWTFNFDYTSYTLTGVIWMLGWCMVLLAAFLPLKPITICIVGLVIIFGQQIFRFVPEIFSGSSHELAEKVWGFFYPTGFKSRVLTGTSGLENIFGISILYVLIPWIGVMMAGYGFGQLLLHEPNARKKICLRIGISAIVLFIVWGTILILVSPSADLDAPFILKLLGQQKYPPSQLFLLMTLGPVIALVPWAEKTRGWLARVLVVIGRVPLFYYLLHLLLIHLSAFVVNLALSGSIHQEWYNTAPLVGIPEIQRWGLPLLYLVWIVDVIILYFICRRYAKYKSNHPEKRWVKYL